MKKINICLLANKIQALINCIAANNSIWEIKHKEDIDEMEELLPHGSGLDCGCKFDLKQSNLNRVIIRTSFHHMDVNGFYDGWTDHNIVITPSFLGGYEIKITGKDKNGIKDYLTDLFSGVFYFDLNIYQKPEQATK